MYIFVHVVKQLPRYGCARRRFSKRFQQNHCWFLNFGLLLYNNEEIIQWNASAKHTWCIVEV